MIIESKGTWGWEWSYLKETIESCMTYHKHLNKVAKGIFAIKMLTPDKLAVYWILWGMVGSFCGVFSPLPSVSFFGHKINVIAFFFSTEELISSIFNTLPTVKIAVLFWWEKVWCHNFCNIKHDFYLVTEGLYWGTDQMIWTRKFLQGLNRSGIHIHHIRPYKV